MDKQTELSLGPDKAMRQAYNEYLAAHPEVDCDLNIAQAPGRVDAGHRALTALAAAGPEITHRAAEIRAKCDSGATYQANYLATQPERTENELWRKVDPRDVHRINCDRKHMCGENAMWASRTARPCWYVCDYHRAVFDATGTFWKDQQPA